MRTAVSNASLDAYHSFSAPSLQRKEQEVMSVFRSYPGLMITREQLADRLGWKESAVCGRANSLVAKKALEEIDGRFSEKRKLYPGTGVGFGHGYDAKTKPRVKNNESMDAALAIMPTTRNRRSVWTIPTESYSGAHFATFPRALVEPCVLAGSRGGDLVFDPFLGSGTTAQVAQTLGRRWIGCELNPEYIELQRDRTRQPGLLLGAA